MNTAYMVGRRPIFDATLTVRAYKFDFATYSETGLSTKTTDGVSARLASWGDPGMITAGRRALLSVPLAFLPESLPLAAAPGSMAIEVRDPIDLDECALKRLAQLRHQGHAVGFEYSAAVDEYEDLWTLAGFVKVGIDAIASTDIPGLIERCRAYQVTPVVEDIETPDQLSRSLQQGFKRFEGHLLSRPVTVAIEALSPSRLSCLQLIDLVSSPDTTTEQLEAIISADPGMSYRLLHISSLGSAGEMRRPVRSLRDAVILFGRRRLQGWVTMMLMAGTNGGPSELLEIAMTRARMCELVARSIAEDLGPPAFAVGLVSALDLFLRAAIPDIVKRLSISDELASAIVAHEGPLGLILGDVLGWKLGDPHLHLRSGAGPQVMQSCYQAALRWSTANCLALDQAA